MLGVILGVFVHQIRHIEVPTQPIWRAKETKESNKMQTISKTN